MSRGFVFNTLKDSIMPPGFIYKTTNFINGKIYIGQHISNNKYYLGSGVMLSRAIEKYGRQNFKKEILKHCFSQEQLDVWEKYFIRKFCSTNPKIGYNILPGTSNGFGHVNPATLDSVKKKMSKNHFTKTMSLEDKEKIFDKVRAASKFKGKGIKGSCDEEFLRNSLSGGLIRKKVLQKTVYCKYSESGEIRRFDSCVDAEKILRKEGVKTNSSNISACCRGERIRSDNLYFSYDKRYL